MKVAINIQTKKIIDVMPDNATSESSFLVGNGYVMLDIENPILNHIENEDGMLTKRTDVTKAQLVDKILEKANNYAYLAGTLTGERQAKEKQILKGE